MRTSVQQIVLLAISIERIEQRIEINVVLPDGLPYRGAASDRASQKRVSQGCEAEIHEGV